MTDARPSASRARSSTIIGTGPRPDASHMSGPPRGDISASASRVVSNPLHSPMDARTSLTRVQGSQSGSRPRLAGHKRVSSLPSPPMPDVPVLPSHSALPSSGNLLEDSRGEGLFPPDRTRLVLFTYDKTTSASLMSNNTQPSPLPSMSTFPTSGPPPSRIQFSYSALPWNVQAGDYLEIRRVRQPKKRDDALKRGMGQGLAPQDSKTEGEGVALQGVKSGKEGERYGYVFRVGDDCPTIPNNQIQVPVSIANAFKFQHRSDIEIHHVPDPARSYADFVELHFSAQYLGRADMWRLGMSLENSTVHVGEKVSLAGQAVRADVQGVWRNGHRFSSGIITAKTKTIFRSKSAQVYIFVQLCQEMWEFDEDGERYYEKVVHGFLPDLFTRWTTSGASHLVTIILFARVYYDDEEVEYLRDHDLTLGLMHDHSGKWCKDFFRVIVDFEKRLDWNQALGEIKKRMESSEREILMDWNLQKLGKKGHEHEEKRIVGNWSFAYEGNVLEAINLALNPFDEHYIDRDLSRTGLSMTIVTPGTGHFAVNKNLLRLTTERMIDHGIGLDLVCLTKMPLHSVPLFSYVSERPRGPVRDLTTNGALTKPATPDPLYFDISKSGAEDRELADCYSLAFWVYCSFYSKTHDKPFRKDRFVPRCKMYEIQMLGILDHNLTTVIVPLLDVDELPQPKRPLTVEEKKTTRDDFDAHLFGNAKAQALDAMSTPKETTYASSLSIPTSYQSARLLSQKLGVESSSLLSSSIRALRDGCVALPPIPAEISPPQIPAPPSIRTSSPTRSIESNRPGDVTFSRTSTISIDHGSGTSTPKLGSTKRLKTQASRTSFASKFGATWLFGAISARAQPSHPSAAIETVGRHDVSTTTGSRPSSPVIHNPTAHALPIPGAPIVVPSTPSPSKDKQQTQPLPILAKAARIYSDEEISRSLRHNGTSSSVTNSKFVGAKSFEDGSWRNKAQAAFGRDTRHATVNPCNPSENRQDRLGGHGRRWQHIRPQSSAKQHVVKWRSLCAPACLPLTTDFMPTQTEIQEYYEANSYDIACFADQVSFLVRPDAAQVNLPLAVMREMASQRLSQNFQFIVLPHDQKTLEMHDPRHTQTRKVLLPGDSTQSGLRAGGASEVLKDANGAIFLSWSNHIHRLAFDPMKQSVTVQRFVRKLRYSMEPVQYQCLVWPYQMNGYQGANATFHYPNVDARLNFNYLDRLIAGEEDQLTSSLRYWRTRFILIPSDVGPATSQNIMPKGEQFNPNEILMTGALKVIELLSRNQWRPADDDKPKQSLRVIPTTFDPSACVMDDGLMTELERFTSGKEKIDGGKTIEGMTLKDVGVMMCQPNNGLIIRDRWWNLKIYEDSFAGEQFCEWLLSSFTDIQTRDQAVEWGKSLFQKGLIEHISDDHGFLDGHFFYRLRPTYDINHKTRQKSRPWFGGRSTKNGRDVSPVPGPATSPGSNAPLARPSENMSLPKKRKIKMSQSMIIDLDPGKKSDRAEMAVLHADIIHNARNAFHIELNWLGVTAGLLDELRVKCSTMAERYGIRFLEAPVEQIKDISAKSAYRAAIPIRLALEPPTIPDLHLRLPERGAGHTENFFEYSILTQKFGFVLDVEAAHRYPENIEVQYSYRGETKFEFSQFCHTTGLALVQCIGGSSGFLWSDNRLFIAAAARRGARNTDDQNKASRMEQARALREELTAFCSDAEALRQFYHDITPPLMKLEDGRRDEDEIEKVE